jgi:hypothetical protein
VTQRRVCHKCGDSIVSNYFDDLVRGLGKRGSTFADIDAVSHDGSRLDDDRESDRFLLQEFKQEGESMPKGQKILLRALARVDLLTVWVVRRRSDGLIDWYDVARSHAIEPITETEYQRRYACWWAREDFMAQAAQPTVLAEMPPPQRGESISASDISWS